MPGAEGTERTCAAAGEPCLRVLVEENGKDACAFPPWEALSQSNQRRENCLKNEQTSCPQSICVKVIESRVQQREYQQETT